MTNFPTKPTLNDAQHWHQRPSSYKTITTTGQIKATDGVLTGFFNRLGTPTVIIYDYATETGTVLVKFTAADGTYYPLPNVYFGTACFVSLTSGSSATIFYK